jgi:hypothetical protein
MVVMDSPRGANHYELKDDRVRVTYSTSGIDGQPHLTYDAESGEASSFAGTAIRSSRSDIGNLVHVILEDVPDESTRILTLVTPDVNVVAGEAECTAVIIETVTRTSIGGPRLVQGAIHSYTAREIRGLARFVQF